jgi:hypothetical protein
MYSPIIQSLSWDTDSSEFFPLEKPGDSARLMRHIRLPKEMYLPFTQFSEVDIDNNKALLE